VRSLVPLPRLRIGFVLAFAIVSSAVAPSEAAAPGFCRPSEALRGHVSPVERVAECDECRTSGRRAGYKRCCELIGGDYRCTWVRC
jgi:hypothetical protein